MQSLDRTPHQGPAPHPFTHQIHTLTKCGKCTVTHTCGIQARVFKVTMALQISGMVSLAALLRRAPFFQVMVQGRNCQGSEVPILQLKLNHCGHDLPARRTVTVLWPWQVELSHLGWSP